jgi:hypothetical protein
MGKLNLRPGEVWTSIGIILDCDGARIYREMGISLHLSNDVSCSVRRVPSECGTWAKTRLVQRVSR